MIIKKYYTKKGRLRNLDKQRTDEPIFRFKKLEDKSIFPCCDFKGICTNKAYAEVFPGALKKGKAHKPLYIKQHSER